MAKRMKLKTILPILLLLVLVGGIYWFMHRNEESTDDAAIDGNTIIVSPKVAGYVTALNIADNQQVKAGDVLLEIDPADYTLRRDRAQALLEAAKAQVISSDAVLDKAVRDLKRMQSLSDKARSQEQLEEVISAEKTARANRDQIQAQVRQAEVELAQAEKDLADTKITAAADGRVTKRGVERGNYVQPGQQLATLVSRDMWVVANLKETQLKHIRPGDAVDISVDAFPDVELHGKVESVQAGTGAYFSAFPPENATGNYVKIIQRVPVKIVFDELPDDKLHIGPGMSVVPTIHTGGHRG